MADPVFTDAHVPELMTAAVAARLLPLSKLMSDDVQQALLRYSNAVVAAAPKPAVPAAEGALLPTLDASDYRRTDDLVFAGVVAEGDKRLLALLVKGLGYGHPAVDDLVALIFRAKGLVRGGLAQPSAEAGETSNTDDRPAQPS